MKAVALWCAILTVTALLVCIGATIWVPEGGSALQARFMATDFVLFCLAAASIGFYTTREESRE